MLTAYQGTPGNPAPGYDFDTDHSIQAIDLKIEITTAGSSSDSFGTLNRRLSANPQ